MSKASQAELLRQAREREERESRFSSRFERDLDGPRTPSDSRGLASASPSLAKDSHLASRPYNPEASHKWGGLVSASPLSSVAYGGLASGSAASLEESILYRSCLPPSLSSRETGGGGSSSGSRPGSGALGGGLEHVQEGDGAMHRPTPQAEAMTAELGRAGDDRAETTTAAKKSKRASSKKNKKEEGTLRPKKKRSKDKASSGAASEDEGGGSPMNTTATTTSIREGEDGDLSSLAQRLSRLAPQSVSMSLPRKPSGAGDSESHGGSMAEDDSTSDSIVDLQRAGKAPTSPPKTPRKLTDVPISPRTSLAQSAPTIPSPYRKSRTKRNGDGDSETFGSATVGSSSVDSISNSGDTPGDETGSILFRELDSSHSFDDTLEGSTSVNDNDHSNLSANVLAAQVLAASGLALGMAQPPTFAPISPEMKLSSDSISSNPRAQSWSSSTKVSRPRLKSLKRQIVMMEGEPTPKPSQTSINSSKISHLTIDYLVHLIANTQVSQDKNFLDTLILTHDYFMKSTDLLAVLVHIYRGSQPSVHGPTSSHSTSSATFASGPGKLSASTSTIPSSSGGPSSSSRRSSSSDSQGESAGNGGLNQGRDVLASIDESDSMRTGEESSTGDAQLDQSGSTSPRGSIESRKLKPRDRTISELINHMSLSSQTSGGVQGGVAAPGTTRADGTSTLLPGGGAASPSPLSPQSSSSSLSGQSPPFATAENAEMERTLQRMRTINMLKKLIEMRFYVLRRSRSFAMLLQKFVVELLTSNDENEARFGEVLKTAMKTNAAFVRTDEASEGTAFAPAPVLTSSSSNITTIRYKSASARKSLDDYSHVELARQITLIDFANWTAIPLSEFAHASFNAKDASTRCPRITLCTARFNDLAQWVSSTVVLAAKKKHRIAVLAKFIQVMDELKRLQNFHALMAFYSALNQAAILRLRKTWKGISSRIMVQWQNISKFFDNSQDFKTYRDYLKSADPPCIPYIGFILGGLTFVEEFPNFIVEENQASEEQPSTTTEGSSPVKKKTRTTKSGLARSKDTDSPERIERPKTSKTDSPERSVVGDRERAASMRLPSKKGSPAISRTSRNRQSESSGADTEPADQDPSSSSQGGTPNRRRAQELDGDSAASSEANLSDFPSPPESARSYKSERRRSNPSMVSGGGSTDMESSDSDSEIEASGASATSASDDSRLRRVLEEPIPTTVLFASQTTSQSIAASANTIAVAAALANLPSGNGSPAASPPAIRKPRSEPSDSPPRAVTGVRPKKFTARTHTLREVLGQPQGPPAGQQFLNWRKMAMVSKSFADILRFQRTRFDLVVVKEIEKFVSDLRQHSWFLDGDELASMSLEIEAEPSDSSSSSARDTIGSVRGTITATVSPAKDGSKKKDKKDKNKARPTFEALSSDQILFSEFRKFLIAQYCHENLLFWEAVNKFKQIDMSQPQAKIKAMANEIFGRFISGTVDDGSFTIGFSQDIRDAVSRKMNANDFEPTMFDVALQEVEHSLLKPSFGQFLNETYSK